MMERVKIRLTVVDTVAIFNEAAGDFLYNPRRAATRDFWFELPADWLSGKEMDPDRLEPLFEQIYGAGWRNGNGDGSRSILLSHAVRRLGNPGEEDRPRAINAACYRYWDLQGFTKVSPKEFMDGA